MTAVRYLLWRQPERLGRDDDFRQELRSTGASVAERATHYDSKDQQGVQETE